jgi:hypothetical protein
MLATIAPGPASSGVPSGTNAATATISAPALSQADTAAGLAGFATIRSYRETAPGATVLHSRYILLSAQTRCILKST